MDEMAVKLTEVEKPKQRKFYIVYSQKLAGFLMLEGFRLVKMGKNKVYPEYNIFLFHNSDALMDAVNRYNG